MELEAKAPTGIPVPAKLAIALLSTIVALSFFAAQASAITLYHHPFVGTFGPKGVGSSAKFVKAHAVAVDQGSHDVYVFDTTKEGITQEISLYRFTSAGAPHAFTAGPGAGTNVIGLTEPGSLANLGSGRVAVAPPGSPAGTAGDVYVMLAGKVEVYSPEGAHLGTIDGSGNPNPGSTVANTITTDPAGNLYINYDEHLDKYVPSANPPKNSDFNSELRFEVQGSLCDVALSSSTIYTTICAASSASWLRYPPTFPGGGGSAVPAPEGPAAPALGPLATDFSNDDFYVNSEHGYVENAEFIREVGVDQFDDAGNPISFTNIVGDLAADVDIDATSGQLYIPDQKNIRIYGKGEPVAPPTAAIDPVATFDFQSAHFTGTVNPGGSGALQETAYRFECSPECPGLEGERTVPGDGADHVVSDDTSGLQPATKYEVTLIARNTTIPKALKAAESRSTISFETAAKPAAEAPEVTIDPVGDFDAESAHLTGTVNPKGSGELQATTYRFEYSTDGLKWISAGDKGPIEGDGAQAVSTDITGLNPNTTYQVRLHAKNVGGEVTSALPNPTFTTDSIAPLVEVTHATHVLTSTAQLNGRIDPGGTQTSYYFQWGTADCASNPCTSVPASKDGNAGAGNGFTWVKAQVAELSPSSSYSYRLIAKNSAGEVVSISSSFTTAAPQGGCSNEGQRVGFASALPDCRAYEMVSPLDKQGGNVTTLPRRTRVAADGNAVTFKSNSPFAGATGAPYAGVEYISLRGADGWQTHAISPYQRAPYDVTQGSFIGLGYAGFFSPALDTGVFRALAPIAGATTPNVAERPNLYLATGLRSGKPKFQLLSDSETPLGPFEASLPYTTYADASADFRKVAFETRDNLTALASGNGFKLYEWEGGSVRLAGILPDSACGSPPCVASESVAGAGATFESTNVYGTNTDVDHAVSVDGSKVFFTAPTKEMEHFHIGSIYARLNGQSTVQIDASESSTPDPKGPGHSVFGAASADGNVVYFSSTKQLVNDSKGASLYRYEFEKPAGHRLTPIPLPGGGGYSEVVGLSRSGAFAYVLSNGRLFVVHNGKALLVAENLTSDTHIHDATVQAEGNFRVASDGRHAVFSARDNLVGYNPASPVCTVCSEVYLYSYDSGDLTCVSCNFGHPPTGEALFDDGKSSVGITDVGLYGGSDTNQNSPLSADGRYVFFSSPDGLVAKDSNGQYDAYAYDSEKDEVRLLSTGQCNCRSTFISASPDGHDAFFTTYQRLVRADTDGQADLYDARIGGGIASQNAIPPAGCQGDACQAQPESRPEVTPSSIGFAGPGSPAPSRKKAKKHKRKKHARHAAKHKRSKRASDTKQEGSK